MWRGRERRCIIFQLVFLSSDRAVPVVTEVQNGECWNIETCVQPGRVLNGLGDSWNPFCADVANDV
jgi:hypothetical protein